MGGCGGIVGGCGGSGRVENQILSVDLYDSDFSHTPS